MSYIKQWKPSPNFTPGSQTRAIYGRPRTIEFGAGHWWDDPSRGPSHNGVVNTFLNPARQASAHAVVSAGLVTEMVDQNDTAWCTNNANPYTFSIECDPRITQGGQAAENIMATLAEYIADKGFHNLQWYPHKHWWSTACNPIDWNEVMRRAKAVVASRNAPQSKPVPAAQLLPEGKLTFRAVLDKVQVWDLATNPNYQSVKTLNKNDTIDVVAFIDFNGTRYYVTQYSYDNGKRVGVNRNDVEQVKPVEEWITNLEDITDVKLMVLPAAGTQVYEMNSGKAIAPLAKGTWVDIAKKTRVGGQTYLISKYSVDNALPNGIKIEDLGIPVEPPKVEKPEWLQNWEDIADVKMYARVKTPLVNLIDGSTIKEIDINTEIEIASATTWHGQKYLITKWSTDKGQAAGIPLANLNMEKIKEPETPAEPVPDKSTEELIKENNSILKMILSHFGIK